MPPSLILLGHSDFHADTSLDWCSVWEMSLPNAALATIDPAKIRDYLLSFAHPVGRFKAAFFVALGYSGERWEALRDDLLAIAQTGISVRGQPSGFGVKYEIDGILNGPSGHSAEVKTIWLVGASETAPRFITAFPR